MMWIDIGLALFLPLRVALFKPGLPRLLEPAYDAPPAERGKEETQFAREK
jgi:hypothetical protein